MYFLTIIDSGRQLFVYTLLYSGECINVWSKTPYDDKCVVCMNADAIAKQSASNHTSIH